VYIAGRYKPEFGLRKCGKVLAEKMKIGMIFDV
jgi:hypothetical protein